MKFWNLKDAAAWLARQDERAAQCGKSLALAGKEPVPNLMLPMEAEWSGWEASIRMAWERPMSCEGMEEIMQSVEIRLFLERLGLGTGGWTASWTLESFSQGRKSVDRRSSGCQEAWIFPLAKDALAEAVKEKLAKAREFEESHVLWPVNMFGGQSQERSLVSMPVKHYFHKEELEALMASSIGRPVMAVDSSIRPERLGRTAGVVSELRMDRGRLTARLAIDRALWKPKLLASGNPFAPTFTVSEWNA
jgi:hypothetical protein